MKETKYLQITVASNDGSRDKSYTIQLDADRAWFFFDTLVEFIRSAYFDQKALGSSGVGAGASSVGAKESKICCC
jgi:hypothetical protein